MKCWMTQIATCVTAIFSFTKENLDSTAFFLSHCHKDHMEGLGSAALTNRLQCSSLKIFCSDTTRNLLLCDPSYYHLKDYLIGIPIEQSYLVQIQTGYQKQEEVLTVTLLSAGHCVGSVMFLFEGTNGNVLYTGDFRLAKGDTRRIKLLHTNGCVKDIKSVYIDTTFCLQKMMSIPSRKETRDAIIKLIDKWVSRGPNHMVSLQCKGMYGYEYLLKEIAQHYKTKIHISKERLALYQYLTDMTQYFTTDAETTKIHSCKWDKSPKGLNSSESLPCGYTLDNGLVPKVIKIKPSSMWFARQTEPLPLDCTRYVKHEQMWRVVHSMHASMEEIIDLVSYLKPFHVYPNVEPAGLYSVDDARDWLREFTHVDKCDSCNQEDSQPTVMATEFSVKKCARKSHVTEKQAIPSETVNLAYKELGLEEDSSLVPLPVKRKRKIGNNTLL